MKKLFSLLSIILISLVYINVNAMDFDISAKGSAKITIKYSEEEAISGAKVDLYKVADLIVNENGNIEYKYVDELSGEVFKLTDLTNVEKNDSSEDEYKKSAEAAKKIDFSKLEAIKTGVTDSNGIVEFNDLELGLYLVNQSNTVEHYTKIDPYLFTVPGYTDNEWIYDIESLPKPTIEKLDDLTITKVWNNNTNEALPESITVNIYNASELFKTVEITANNNWTITLKNVPYSTDYSVKEENIPSGYNAAYKKDAMNFTIINTNKLPQTGAFTFIIPIFVLVGITLASIGLYLEKRN